MYAYFGGVPRLSYIQPFSAVLVVFDGSEWSLHLFCLLVLAREGEEERRGSSRG
jgi:hypothetical protein